MYIPPIQEEIEELMATDRWLGVTLEARNLSRHRQMERHPLDMRREGESLLLAGTQRGFLVLLDELNGSIKFSIRAHNGAVRIVACSPKSNQIISASEGIKSALKLMLVGLNIAWPLHSSHSCIGWQIVYDYV